MDKLGYIWKTGLNNTTMTCKRVNRKIFLDSLMNSASNVQSYLKELIIIWACQSIIEVIYRRFLIWIEFWLTAEALLFCQKFKKYWNSWEMINFLDGNKLSVSSDYRGCISKLHLPISKGVFNNWMYPPIEIFSGMQSIAN